jgi:hypothetical protein
VHAGEHAIRWRPLVDVAEKSGPRRTQVGQARGCGAVAEEAQHGRRNVDGCDVPEPARGRQGELAGSRAQIHHDRVRVESVRLESGQVFRWIRIPLLPVEPGHESLIEVLGSRIRQLVDHPVLGHPSILPLGHRALTRTTPPSDIRPLDIYYEIV